MLTNLQSETSPTARRLMMESIERKKRMNPKPKLRMVEIVEHVEPEPVLVQHQVAEPVPVPAKNAHRKWSFVVDMNHGEKLQAPVPSLWCIKDAVATRYGVTIVDLESDRRTADIVKPRQIGYYLCATMTRRALPAIGRAFGGRDHTTALSGRNKIARLIIEDIHFNEEILALKASILATFNDQPLEAPSGSTLLQTRKEDPLTNAERVAGPEVQVPPPPILPHGKDRSMHAGTSS